ncbi:MAG: helix-turn-helix domain-containing protein [Planctomycetes bacterium]|nr:helix-turn-helix domain-containing protein [Planctomycetota bacterium]
MDPREEFLTVKQVADWLGVTRGTVYQWKSRRLIPCTKIGSTLLIPRRALLAALQRTTVMPGGVIKRPRRNTRVTRRVDELREEGKDEEEEWTGGAA